MNSGFSNQSLKQLFWDTDFNVYDIVSYRNKPFFQHLSRKRKRKSHPRRQSSARANLGKNLSSRARVYVPIHTLCLCLHFSLGFPHTHHGRAPKISSRELDPCKPASLWRGKKGDGASESLLITCHPSAPHSLSPSQPRNSKTVASSPHRLSSWE